MPGGKRIRKSTETNDRAKAEVIEKTFRMGLNREAPADRLHAMLDAVCGFTNKTRDHLAAHVPHPVERGAVEYG